MIDRMIDHLEADAILVALAEGGIHDRDIRAAGPGSTPGAYGDYGDVKPTLCLIPGPEMPRVFDHPASYVRSVHALAIGPRTDAGRRAIEAILDRTLIRLYRWHDPTTGAVIGNGGRTGRVEDVDGVMDRLTLTVTGMHPVENW